MPIVSNTALTRKKYFATVWEVFGIYPDINLFRCRTKSDKIQIANRRATCFSQCAAEFCYELDPHIEFTDAEKRVYRDNIPVEKCINIEFENDRRVAGENTNRDTNVSCKFCRESVGYLKNNRVNFYYVESWKPQVDIARTYETWGFLPLVDRDQIFAERYRSYNIPFNIRDYLRRHNIQEEIVKRRHTRAPPSTPIEIGTRHPR